MTSKSDIPTPLDGRERPLPMGFIGVLTPGLLPEYDIWSTAALRKASHVDANKDDACLGTGGHKCRSEHDEHHTSDICCIPLQIGLNDAPS